LGSGAGFAPIGGGCESHRDCVLAGAKREWLIEIVWRERCRPDSESTSDFHDPLAAAERTIVVGRDDSDTALAREAHRRDFLVREIKNHAQVIEWEGDPTGADRFVKNGLAAIRWYVLESEVRCRVQDRQPIAQELFARGTEALKCAAAVLEEISENHELSSYLAGLYMNGPRPSSSRDLKRWTRQREAYEKISPANAARSIMHLEPVLALAAEQLKRKPGDYQRNPTVNVFVEEMMLAWVSGTGQIPTCATRNSKSKNDSPFLAMLKRINSEIFEVEGVPPIRDIVGVAQAARREIKTRYPGL
jgi:hypothetical protein